MFQEDFADQVAKLCLDKFNDLPNQGKPITGKEWTLLSGIVQSTDKEDGTNHLKVVALATGTKCIGASKLCSKGMVINDSHAEVLARRALLRYFFSEIESIHKGQPSIFIPIPDDPLENTVTCSSNLVDSKKHSINFSESSVNSFKNVTDMSEKSCPLFKLQPGVKFHFFCSRTPCGDASIFLKDNCDNNDKCHGKRFAADDDEVVGPSVKKCKMDNDNNDIHRTGAKCLNDEIRQDPHLPGSKYHITGAVRTKPGRGDPTLSVSCSDKLFRWNSCGIQGGLLSLLIESVYLSSVIVGGGCPYSEAALSRAIIDRANNEKSQLKTKVPPYLMHSSVEFEHAKYFTTATSKPCPSSVVWWAYNENFDNGYCEVLVNGRKQGVTKKTMNKLSSSSALCKKALLDVFKKLWIDRNVVTNITLAELKSKASFYQRQWLTAKSHLGCWTNKPKDLLDFT